MDFPVIKERVRKAKIHDKVRYNGLVCKVSYVFLDNTVNLAQWSNGEPIEPRAIPASELIFADENGVFPIPDQPPTLDDLQSAGLVSIGVPTDAEITLPPSDQWQLDTYEAAIAEGLVTFQKVGNALLAIRDNKLYRAKHSTFEEYLDKRWQMGRSYASRLMGAAEVANTLLPIGNIAPVNEAQTRPMNHMPPEQAQATWERAVTEKADGKQPTAAQVKEAAEEVKAEASQQPTPTPVAKLATPLPQHRSDSNEWYTPAKFLAPVRALLEQIDLDPASCEVANQNVQALEYFTEAEDGFSKVWHGRVFLNPPYGKDEDTNESNAGRWAARLINAYESGEIDEAVLLVNASTGAEWFQPLWRYSICFVQGRISFIPSTDKKNQPTHYNCFVYFGKRPDEFADVFVSYGVIR